MANSFKVLVNEFLAASLRSYSYNPFKNGYIWFGLLWGLPIPLASVFFQTIFVASDSTQHPAMLVISTPMQWFFLAHPFFFGALFGILGTVRQQKDTEVRKLIEELKIMSVLDPLTGLNNRRSFSHIFADELARVQRSAAPLALLFLDLDHFKAVNDTYGHHKGDEILQATASYLRNNCRPYDTPGRWGGEEFVVLLPSTTEQEATEIAERIRIDFASGLGPSALIPVKVSVGVTQYQLDDTLDSLVDRADQALYHAKTTGRNKVVPWTSIPTTA